MGFQLQQQLWEWREKSWAKIALKLFRDAHTHTPIRGTDGAKTQEDTHTHTLESLVKRCLLILDGSGTCEDFVMKSCQKCLVQMLTCFEEVIEKHHNLCAVSRQLYLIFLYWLYCFCVCKQDFFPGGHVKSRSRYAKSFALQTGKETRKTFPTRGKITFNNHKVDK